MGRFAVIDLGTNTFHLLIAEPGTGALPLREVYRYSRFVKLAEEGIQRIGEKPYARGLETMHFIAGCLQAYGVEQVVALGTAALRTAANGPDFIRQVEAETGISVQLINGDREAELIARGALAALPPLSENILIMDIGGGSVEFILAGSQGVHWAQSFPVGVAVLYKHFHQRDPIAAEEVGALQDFLQEQLQPLRQALITWPTTHLVGAAGTFEVLAGILASDRSHPLRFPLDLDAFPAFYRRLLRSTLADRLAMPEIPADRADMIVVALILVRFILDAFHIQKVTVSCYAMKEGMLSEMMAV